jgi:hypothetical protein
MYPAPKGLVGVAADRSMHERLVCAATSLPLRLV